ncbi:response regulator transcription factor [Parendozoicomonas sp. Alg238-R29]|uniref:response regulator transcription factor n=1 Tax=Parendozoicomonas sp. Alg238-R29 TaxID=2993446 RepID=UPI00248DA676|nr:response regulator transcription factor [Parendozoicomonas sp. Alg238-R29]
MDTVILKALIVEDEPVARTLLAEYMRTHGWEVSELSDGSEILDHIRKEPVDIIFLDLRLPGIDGQTLCKKLRSLGNSGVIFTTSCDDPVERIIALENGADAYYVKPLPLREILACAKNLAYRVRSTPQSIISNHQPRFGSWHFSRDELLIKNTRGENVNLTRNETRILDFMIQHANTPLSREKLGKTLGRTDWHPDDRGIDVLVSKLRNKLTKISGDNQLIKTQYGVGYVFTASDS